MNALQRIAKKGLKTPGNAGKAGPRLQSPSTGGSAFQLSSQRDSKVVLYFYPKDNTPGCTAEGADFGDNHKAFQRAGCRVSGISRDSLASHQRFKEKMKFPLEHVQVRGIERSTFLIDEKGVLAREWRGVKVPGHAEEVLNFVKAL